MTAPKKLTPTQELHALTSGYIKIWKQKYPNAGAPNFNANKAVFGWKAMRMTMSVKEIQELVEFFFTLPSSKQHDLHAFLWDYDEIVEKKRVTEKDRAQRAKIAQASEQRTREFEERVARIKHDQRSPEN